jgi:hypothetical protein
VVTKGRILSSSGEASPQIDVLVLWPSYPPFLLNKKLYLASGVAAAFECKLTFRKGHLKKLFETAVKLSAITTKEHRDRVTSRKDLGQNFAYEEFHRLFEYGLLAHSFEGSDPDQFANAVTDEMNRLDKELVSHPSQMVDLICISDLGSWVSERKAIDARIVMRDQPPNTYNMVYLPHPYSNYHCLTGASWSKGSEIRANFSPLGSFLARFYRKLSRADRSLEPLAKFYTTTLSTGQGGGVAGRMWPEIETPTELWNQSQLKRQRNEHLKEYEFLGF